MTQIALTRFTSKLDDLDLAFVAEACNAQVVECAERWGLTPTPVVFYSDIRGLPAGQCRIMSVVDDIDAPGAAGYHSFDFGFVYSKVLAQSLVDTAVTISHECLEELVDPFVNQWRDIDSRRQTALEICDAVQADVYPQNATVLGETRPVMVSNYLTPAWFDPAARSGFDRMGRIEAPFAMSPGGYMIVRDRRTGAHDNVFARLLATPRAHAVVGAKMTLPDSRTLRRLRGVP